MDELKRCFGSKLNRTYYVIVVRERKQSGVTPELLLDTSGCPHRCHLVKSESRKLWRVDRRGWMGGEKMVSRQLNEYIVKIWGAIQK